MKYGSDRLDQVGVSASVAASEKARAMNAEGLDVISLATGEPDFPTPAYIADAGVSAIRAGNTRYVDTRGTQALRAAVSRKFQRDNGIDYRDEEIICGAGAKALIATTMQASLNPGDEVIIPAPSWVSYSDITKLAGGVPVVIPTSAENDFKLSPEALEAAITKHTRWLLINSPNNPTGTVYARAELEALGAVLARHPQVLVLTDEIYEHLLFDNSAFISFVEAVPAMRERTLTVNGASKVYSMTGWRVGYAGGPAPLVKAMAKVAGQMIGSPCAISCAAATAALDAQDQDFIAEHNVEYQSRRDRVLELLANVPGLSIFKPAGAFYLYIECAGLIGASTPDGKRLETDSDVVDWLLNDALVVTVTGAAYGLSPYFRISIATALSQLERACERIRASVAKLKLGVSTEVKSPQRQA